MKLQKLTTFLVNVALVTSVVLIPQSDAFAYKSPVHIFNMNDVMRGYDGSGYGPDFAIQRLNTFCGLPGLPVCGEVDPVQQDDDTTLYPIDSEFGYYVVDMLGAQQKTMDLIYMEGFAGDIIEGGEIAGLRVLNAASDFYKASHPYGTWCRSSGGEYFKCDSKHYTVMEHNLSCHEVIPYYYADPITGEQALLEFPDGAESYDCMSAQLDDETFTVVNGTVTGTRLTDATPCVGVNDPVGCQMFPNGNTTLLNDLAVSSDYSLRLQNNGTPVYAWGNAVKMPNEVRVYARIPLPEEWKAPGMDFPVTSAKLVLKYDVAGNADDLIRPEDLENDAATGRGPSYKLTYETGNKQWVSLAPCYEGDGDFIDADIDPTTLDVGTVLMNDKFKVGGGDPTEPLPFSEDLGKALTNAWYTSLDRDPFEWSYLDGITPAEVFEFVGSALPDATLGQLVSGPQWMLKSTRYPADLTGVSIPAIDCTPPASQDGAVKYHSGSKTVSVINLLDWDRDTDGPSPLDTSVGWVDITQNPFVEVTRIVNGFPIGTSGSPMTEDFDLVIYVREEMQPISLYSAQLFVNEEPTAADMAIDEDSSDAAITEFKVPIRPPAGSSKRVTVVITNTGTTTIPEVDVVVSNNVQGVVYTASYSGLAPDEVKTFAFKWNVPTEGSIIEWTAKVLDDDVELDEATAVSTLR